MIGCGFIDVWESLDVCQGIILDMVVSWMLYGNVSIQVRCDLRVGLGYGWCGLGVEWGGVGRGFVWGFVWGLEGGGEGLVGFSATGLDWWGCVWEKGWWGGVEKRVVRVWLGFGGCKFKDWMRGFMG